EVTIEILEANGKSVKKFSSKAPETPAGAQPEAGGGEEGPRRFGGGPAPGPAEKSVKPLVWGFCFAPATPLPRTILWWGKTSGPRAVPGAYQVKLIVEGKTMSESFELKKDPRVSTTQEEFQKQIDLLTKIRDKFSETSEAIISIRDVRKQAQDYAARVKGQPNVQPIIDAAKTLGDKLTAVEEELYQTKNRSNQDPLNFPIRLNNKLAALAGSIAGADAQPTDQQVAVYEDLTARINAQLEKLRQALATDVPAFNKLVRDQNAPAVWVKSQAG